MYVELSTGFIDQHVHLIGGGGEAGPTTRTPEVAEEIESDVDLLKDAYEKLSKESGIDFTSLDEDYEDAFDHIEYLDESFFEEGNLEEMTEEVFPGVRKLKGKSK